MEVLMIINIVATLVLVYIVFTPGRDAAEEMDRNSTIHSFNDALMDHKAHIEDLDKALRLFIETLGYEFKDRELESSIKEIPAKFVKIKKSKK